MSDGVVITKRCPRHGGTWGEDDQCFLCCDADGEPRAIEDLAVITVWVDKDASEDLRKHIWYHEDVRHIGDMTPFKEKVNDA